MPWNDLGTVTPSLTSWTEYSPSVIPENPIEGTTYRITPVNLAAGDRFATYCLLRFRYDDGTTESVTRSIRVYPYPEPVIQTVPIPLVVSINPFSWIPQIRKFVYPRFRGRSGESAWAVRVEDYYPTAAMPDEQAIEIIDKIQRYLY